MTTKYFLSLFNDNLLQKKLNLFSITKFYIFDRRK